MRATKSSSNLSTLITQTLLTSQKSWTPKLEQTLHKLSIPNSLTPTLVSQVINSLQQTQHYKLALGFFNWASQQPNFAHNSLTYNSIVKTLSQSQTQLNALQTLFKQCRNTREVKLSCESYDCVVAALVRNGRTRNALLVYRECGVALSGGALGGLIAGLASDGCLDDAREVFDELVKRDSGVGTVGFGCFLWCWCRERGLDGVLRMVEKVGCCGVNGSIVAVLVVDGLCKGGRVEEGFWVLDELRRRGFKPDFIAYRVVAEGYREMEMRVEMEMVLKKKRKLGVAPREGDYMGFILELVQEGRVREAKELGEIIVSGNFPIEDCVLNTLIEVVSGFDIESAVGFFYFMIGKGIFPTITALSDLSNNLCKHGRDQVLLEVYEKLSCSCYFADEESYGMRIYFLCKAGKVREAYGALQEMKRNGFGPNVSLYNAVLDACCKADLLRPAKRLWDEMFASGCPVNLETYNILIRKFSEVGQVEDSQRLFDHMLDKGLKPDATTYTHLLEGLCQEAKLGEAVKVFNQSVKQDGIVSDNNWSTLFSYLCKNGASRGC